MPEATRLLLIGGARVGSNVRRGFAGRGTLPDRLIRTGRSVTAGIWYVSRIMDHQWPKIFRGNHVRRFIFLRVHASRRKALAPPARSVFRPPVGVILQPPGIDRVITSHHCRFLPRSETHAVQAARTLGSC